LKQQKEDTTIGILLVRVTGLEGAKNRIVVGFQRLLIPKTSLAIRQINITQNQIPTQVYFQFIPNEKSQSLSKYTILASV